MDVRLYCCYSLDLRNYLYKNGVKYKVVGLNPNSKRMFWVFIKDEQFEKLIQDYERLRL